MAGVLTSLSQQSGSSQARNQQIMSDNTASMTRDLGDELTNLDALLDGTATTAGANATANASSGDEEEVSTALPGSTAASARTSRGGSNVQRAAPADPAQLTTAELAARRAVALEARIKNRLDQVHSKLQEKLRPRMKEFVIPVRMADYATHGIVSEDDFMFVCKACSESEGKSRTKGGVHTDVSFPLFSVISTLLSP